MTKALSPEETDKLKLLRAQLRDIEKDMATARAISGNASEYADDGVVAVLKRIPSHRVNR